MLVTVNKKEMELKEGTTVLDLVTSMNYRRSSVWLNGNQLLMAEYEKTVIQPEDQLKILRIVAGG